MTNSILSLIEKDANSVIEHLLMSDMDYWEAVKVEVIYPFLDESKPYGRRIREKNVDRDDVYSHIYEKMVVGRKLDKLRNKEQLCPFIIEYIKAYVRSLFEKKARQVEEIAIESVDDTKEGGIEQFPQPNTGFSTYKIVNGVISQRPQESNSVPSDGNLPDAKLSAYQALRTGFDDLWEQNPRRALVLLLRYVKGLSSREIRSFLDMASENYVNQVVNVAKGNMRTNYLSVADAIGKEDA